MKRRAYRIPLSQWHHHPIEPWPLDYELCKRWSRHGHAINVVDPKYRMLSSFTSRLRVDTIKLILASHSLGSEASRSKTDNH